MRNVVIACLILTVLLAACSTPTPEVITVERTVEVPVEITVPIEVPVTVVVTSTPEPPPDPTATPSPEPTEETQTGPGKAANFVATQERDGLVLELARVYCLSPEGFLELQQISTLPEEFEESAAVCEIILRITNNTEETIAIHPAQGQVIVENEQLEPYDFRAYIGEDIDGDIYGGVTLVGGYWFGVKRSTWEEINTLRYVVRDHRRGSPEFDLQVDMSDWGFEPMPEDLL